MLSITILRARWGLSNRKITYLGTSDSKTAMETDSSSNISSISTNKMRLNRLNRAKTIMRKNLTSITFKGEGVEAVDQMEEEGDFLREAGAKISLLLTKFTKKRALRIKPA